MSDKNLTELEWRKFAKGRDLKDVALVKALAALEKAKAPEAELEALAEIEKHAEELRKANRSDKELLSHLSGLDKALDKQRKLSESEARKAAAANDDEESPAALTTQMIPLLRQIRKGDEFPVMLGVTSKEVAVLISRRGISPSKRKLLADHLGVTAGIKYINGQCLFEENAYTFVVQTQAAGLAKKLKAALLAQSDLRLKVRVRGEDPHDIDDDGEQDENESPQAQREEGRPGAAAQGAAAAAPPLSDPLKAQFQARLAVLEPRVLTALRAQTRDAIKLRAVAEFVRSKGEEGHYKAALQGLESLHKLLDAADEDLRQPVGGKPGSAEVGAAFNARLKALMPEVRALLASPKPNASALKAKITEAGELARDRLYEQAHAKLDDAELLLKSAPPDAEDFRRQWAGVRNSWPDALEKVGAQIGKLQIAFRNTGEPLGVEIADKGLSGLTGRLRVGLQAALIELESAADPQLPQAIAKLRSAAAAMQVFLDTDPVLPLLDGNPYGVMVNIRGVLGAALAAIDEICAGA